MIILILLPLLFSLNSYSQCYENIENNFDSLPSETKLVQRYQPNKIFSFSEYKLSATNKLGLDNHFQGLYQYKDMIFVSGADFKKREAAFFVLKNNKVIKRMRIGDRNLWHSGGISGSGPLVAVSLEPYKVPETKNSIIQVWNMENINNPIKVQEITGLPTYTPAAGLITLPKNQLLIGQLSHKLVLHLNGNAMELNQQGIGGTSFSLLRQCDGNIYLMTFSNRAGKIPVPITKGVEVAKLFLIGHESKLSSKQTIQFVKEREFKCRRNCTFQAGASVKDLGNGKFSIISVNMFRRAVVGDIEISEFK